MDKKRKYKITIPGQKVQHARTFGAFEGSPPILTWEDFDTGLDRCHAGPFFVEEIAVKEKK